jgi:hypothetical protein
VASGYREPDLEVLDADTVYAVIESYMENHTTYTNGITYFDGNLNVIVSIRSLDVNYSPILKYFGDTYSVYIRNGEEQTTFYYNSDGILISTADGDWTQLWKLPVAHTIEGNTLFVFVDGKKIEVCGLENSGYGNYYDTLFGFDSKTGIAIFWTTDNTWVLFDTQSGEIIFETQPLLTATGYQGY